MQPMILAILSVIIVSLISLIGVITFAIRLEKLSKLLLYLVSFSAGALFAESFLHLLPETVRLTGFIFHTSLAILAGIVAFFILEKIVHWHHCHDIKCTEQPRHLAYMNLSGDIIHNFIDGLIIGAAYLINVAAGISVTVAVILHEIPQEIGDFGILLYSGISRKKALLANFLVALTSVAGAFAAFGLSLYFQHILNLLLPFAAGSFIYIAGTDLFPELHKETSLKKSLLQLIAMILGIAVMSLFLMLE